MTQPPPPDDLTPEAVNQAISALGLVPVPEALMPRVIANLRTYRESMRRFAESGLDVADVVTAQPYRADPGGAK